MAQNLLTLLGTEPDLHENKFYMLWNAILQHHFPLRLKYGIAPQTPITGKGTKPDFLVIKVVRDKEDVVLVMELKKPTEDTEGGRENIKMELVKYIEESFDQTEYPTIYAIGSIGLSWVAYKMDKASPSEPQLISNWNVNVTSIASYDAMRAIVDHIDQMAGVVRQ